MRGLVVLLALGLFAVLAAVLWVLANRFERAGVRDRPREPPWRPGQYAEAGQVQVVVERVALAADGARSVLESRAVGAVAEDDDTYAERLADLVLLAQDRARLLNQQAGLR